jgi:anaerobic ribonucleoside-triphosphate reductase activating protein
MHLATYLPLTLCDYPGRIAAIIFTQGCNFRCPWCHNKHLIPSAPRDAENASQSPAINAPALLAEVSARCREGTLEGLVISGGEPTVQPDIIQFLRDCKTLSIPIKLDTNGSNPAILRAAFAENLLAFVAMDVKAPLKKYAQLCGAPVDTSTITESISAICASGIPHQFRVTVIPALLDASDLDAIRALLPSNEPLAQQRYRSP